MSATTLTRPLPDRLLRATAAFHAWVAAEQGRFMPWLAVACMAGVLGELSLTSEPAWWSGGALAGLGLLACVLGWRQGTARAAALLVLAAGAGVLAAQVATWRALPLTPIPSRAAILTATVRGVETSPLGLRLTLSGAVLAEGEAPLQRAVRVRLRAGDGGTLQAGDRIRVRALLRPPAPPAYPGAWDLQRDAYFSGLAASGTALGPVELLGEPAESSLGGWWQGLRDRIGARLRAGLPGSTGAVAAALMTGSTVAIPPDDRAAFRDSGLAHLLAVAGLHIGAVMALVLFVTRLGLALWERAALHWPTRAIAGVAALAAGGGYAALTGGHLPALRSFTMAALVLLALLAGRRAVSLRGLALAAIVIALLLPGEVPGVSYGMSFSAVLALIAGFEALRPALRRLRGDRGGWTRHTAAHVAALAMTSVLAGSASAPFGAYHFGHVQLYFVLGNLVAVPLCAMVTLPAGIAALLLMPFGLEGLALAPMGWSLQVILWIAHGVSALPAAVLAVPHLPAWGLALYALGLAWLGLWRSRVRLAGILPILAGLLSPLVSPPADILVAPDARLIGLRTASGVVFQGKPSSAAFVRDAWLAYWGVADGRALPAAGESGLPDLDCDAAGCTLNRHGALARVLRRDVRMAGCPGWAVLVSPEPARDACRGTAPVIDRFTVWRDGAQAIWLGPAGATILSDRAARGARPWVPAVPEPRRRTTNLPVAERERLAPGPAASTDEAAPPADPEP